MDYTITKMFGDKDLKIKLEKTLSAVTKLQEDLDARKKEEDVNSRFVKDFANKIAIVLDDIRKGGLKNQEWTREFHRLLLNDYVKSSNHKVYGMSYVNSLNKTTRQFLLIAADTFEKARDVGEEILIRMGEDPRQWLIENYKSIDITIPAVDSVAKIDEKLNNPDKPFYVFVNDLKLAKEKWAETPTEKRTIEKLINKIEKVYGE